MDPYHFTLLQMFRNLKCNCCCQSCENSGNISHVSQCQSYFCETKII